jgi:hypothetical protein
MSCVIRSDGLAADENQAMQGARVKQAYEGLLGWRRRSAGKGKEGKGRKDGRLWCGWWRIVRLSTDQSWRNGMSKAAGELGVRGIERASLRVVRTLATCEVLQVREHVGVSAYLPQYESEAQRDTDPEALSARYSEMTRKLTCALLAPGAR